MEEVFAVGVALEVTGNAQAAADKLLRDFDKLTGMVRETVDQLGKFGQELRGLQGASRSVNSLVTALDKLNASRLGGGALADVEKLAAATKEMAAASAELGRSMADNARLATETAKAADAASAAAARMSKAGGGAGYGTAYGNRAGGAGGWPSGTGAWAAGQGPGGAAGAPPGGPGGPGGPGAGHPGQGGPREADYLMAGLAASMAGAPLVSFYAAAVKAGMDVGHLQSVLRADDRVTEAMAKAATEAAAATSRNVPGTTIAGNLGVILDLKQVTGSLPEAMAALPEFAKLVATLRAMDSRSGGTGDAAFAAAKAAEIMGRLTTADAAGNRHIDPAELQRNVALLTQVAVGTNMRVDPAAYLAFAKQARVGGMALSDQALFEDFPAIMMVLGGSRAGTGEAATYQQFINGQMTKTTADMLKVHHLIDAGAQWKGGRVKDMSKHLVGSAEFQADPVEWARKYLIPELVKEGITDPVKQAQAVASFSGRQTTAGFLGDIVRAMAAIDKEAENLKHIKPDSFDLFQATDPSQAMRNIETAWTNLLASFGSAAATDAATGLNHMADALNAIAKWARENPGEAKLALDVAAGLGAVAVALGALSTAIFFMGPALRALGVARAAAAGAGAAGAAGTGGGAVLGAVASPYVFGPAAAGAALLAYSLSKIGQGVYTTGPLGYALEHGADPAYQYNAARRAPSLPVPVPPPAGPRALPSESGPDDDLHALEYVRPPPAAEPRSELRDTVMKVYVVNGRDLAQGVTDHQVRGMSAPQTGPTQWGPRPVITQPGGAVPQ